MDFDARLSTKPNHWNNDRLHFFKYMSESTAKIVLRNRTLRWSTASVLNDPYEMQLDMSVDVDQEGVKSAALEKLWELYSSGQPIPAKNPMGIALELLRTRVRGLSQEYLFQELGPALDEGFERLRQQVPRSYEEALRLISTIKIVSLTIRPDIQLMWSHYANGHRGVVMRFRSIPALDSPFGLAKPMNYSATVPALFSEEHLIELACGTAYLDPSEIIEMIVYNKSSDWAYEHEWRICSGAGRDKQAAFEDLKFGENELDGVIFGLKSSAADRAEVRELAVPYPNIEFMQTRQTRSAFNLAIEPA